MKNRMRVGQKGQVVIPKELRDQAGIREGTEVAFELKDGAVSIRRLGPPTASYVDYFVSTYSKKLTREVGIKKVLEAEPLERHQRLH